MNALGPQLHCVYRHLETPRSTLLYLLYYRNVSVHSLVHIGNLRLQLGVLGRWRRATWAPQQRAAPARRCLSPSSRDLPAQVRSHLVVRPSMPACLIVSLSVYLPSGPTAIRVCACVTPGKTHTVKGVLNVWHMVAYQRYYNSLVSVLSANARNGLNIESVSSALERKCATAFLHMPSQTCQSQLSHVLNTCAGCSKQASQKMGQSKVFALKLSLSSMCSCMFTHAGMTPCQMSLEVFAVQLAKRSGKTAHLDLRTVQCSCRRAPGTLHGYRLLRWAGAPHTLPSWGTSTVWTHVHCACSWCSWLIGQPGQHLDTLLSKCSTICLIPPACILTAQGRVYRPNVVRVGSEEAPLSARARDVWVDGLIRRYMDMEQPGHFPCSWQHFS